MSITQADLDQFHHFASETLDRVEEGLSWDELFIRWESCRRRSQINHDIREGLADVESGRCESAEQAMQDIRSEFGFDK